MKILVILAVLLCIIVDKADGTWSIWSKWSLCPVRCGGGIKERNRDCKSEPCAGDAQQTRPCNQKACRTNGGYSEFSAWSDCSADCGGGEQIQTRTCTNPAPAGGGNDCDGAASQSQACNGQACIGVSWRDDLRCGTKYPIANGDPAQCDPNNAKGFACCSPFGWCGKTSAHCKCDGCIDYKPKTDTTKKDNDWHEYKDSYLDSYASETKYDDLDAAKEACLANDQCNGITREPANGNKYSLRKGSEVLESKSTGETSWILRKTAPDNDWHEYKDSYLDSYASQTKYDDLDAAKEACLANDQCNGITREPANGNKYSLRKGSEVLESKSTGETSWILRKTGLQD